MDKDVSADGLLESGPNLALAKIAREVSKQTVDLMGFHNPKRQ